MSAANILTQLEQEGVRLELSLRTANLRDEHRDLIRHHRTALIDTLRKSTKATETTFGVSRLPWQLERVLSAAVSDALPKGVVQLPNSLIPNLSRYVMAWGCAYLQADRDEAVRRLWEVYRAWQEVS